MRAMTAYLLVLVSAFFWGANFVLAGPVLSGFPPLWAAAFRFLLGALLMFMIVRYRGEKLLHLLRQHAGVYLLLGLVGITAFNLLFFNALKTTSADSAALIMATNPLLTTLLAAVLLNEIPAARQLLALPVALAGVAVVISQGDMDRLAALHFDRGDLLMLAANVAWALYNVLIRRFMPKGSVLGNTTLVMGMGAVLLSLTALVSSETLSSMPNMHSLIALAIMAVGGTVLAYLFWNIGIERLGAGRTAIFLNFVPVSAMLVAALIGVLPTAAQLIGGALVLAGLSITMLPKRKAAA